MLHIRAFVESGAKSARAKALTSKSVMKLQKNGVAICHAATCSQHPLGYSRFSLWILRSSRRMTHLKGLQCGLFRCGLPTGKLWVKFSPSARGLIAARGLRGRGGAARRGRPRSGLGASLPASGHSTVTPRAAAMRAVLSARGMDLCARRHASEARFLTPARAAGSMRMKSARAISRRNLRAKSCSLTSNMPKIRAARSNHAHYPAPRAKKTAPEKAAFALKTRAASRSLRPLTPRARKPPREKSPLSRGGSPQGLCTLKAQSSVCIHQVVGHTQSVPLHG